MPRFDYRCPKCGVFEATAPRNERTLDCACGEVAVRLPFSGLPYLNGATVVSAIPDPQYRQEAQKRELNATWGDASRSVEMLRKNSYIDADGEKAINLKGMNDA